MKRSYHIYAAVTTTCWALSNALTGIAMESFSTFSLAFWRYAVAAVCLTAVLLFRKVRIPELRDIPLFFLCGGLGFLLYTVCFNLGCRESTAAVSSTIIASVPLLTAAAAAFLLKEKLKREQWGAIFIAFAGVLILVLDTDSMELAPGTVWLLAAAVFLSAYNLLQRRITKRYTAIQTSAYSILCGFFLLCFFGPQAVAEMPYASPGAWNCVILMGVFSSAAAYVCWAKAFSLAPNASSVTNYMFLTPFVAVLLGFFISGEVPDLCIVLGGTVILSGLFLFQKAAATDREDSGEQHHSDMRKEQ